MKGITEAQARAIQSIQGGSLGELPKNELCVTINFHPDRLTQAGLPVLMAMAKAGYLKSQFETKTSNGSLTAYLGGKRWRWEHEAFNGIYDDSTPQERPKYGALNYNHHDIGGSPRFGSAHFRLCSHVLNRTTFCYPDSFFSPKDFSTYHGVARLIHIAEQPFSDGWDELDHYIEAHIHGEINIERDVEALVLDPVYLGTNIEQQARALPCTLDWHAGFKLPIVVFEQHVDYRGKPIVELAKNLAQQGIITPDLIGYRLKTAQDDPQDLKKVWHYLVRFGYGG